MVNNHGCEYVLIRRLDSQHRLSNYQLYRFTRFPYQILRDGDSKELDDAKERKIRIAQEGCCTHHIQYDHSLDNFVYVNCSETFSLLSL